MMLNNTLGCVHTLLIQFSITLHKNNINHNRQLAFGADVNANKTCQTMEFNQ